MSRSKLLLLALIGAAVAAFFAFGLHRHANLEAVQAAHGRLAAWYAERPAAVLAGYFAVYVLSTALSLPGATLLTLLGGALFGLWTGLVVVSFASTIGATLAMLVARHLLREHVERRIRSAGSARLAELDRGIAREGAFYLFTLRLVPLVPFVVINLALGLSKMPARTFYAVSQLGMLPGTLVYVNAGTQLGQLRSLDGILSPALLGSFVLLGLFPLAAKKALAAWRTRRAVAPWAAQRPRRFDRNLVVIGAGAAGLVTSYLAAAVKAKVTLVEAKRMGGDCLYTGCVPSKALIRTAALVQQMREAPRYGVARADWTLDFAQVMAQVADAVRTIEPHDSVERYRGLGVDVQLGHARIVDPWHVAVTHADGRRTVLSTRAIVVATGAAPVVPPLPGLAEVALTSDTLWALRTLPARLLVLGGGPIGCELAQAFARLGSAVTQVEMGERLLAREDADVSAFVRTRLEADGVVVRTGARALRVEHGSGGRQLIVEVAGEPHAIAFDELLCAVGRQARVDGFGLDTLGLLDANGRLEADDALATRMPNIFVAGDVAGRWQFTHTAAHQAWHAAVNGLLTPWKRFAVDARVIPWCTFVDPEVARVGLNEQEARAQGIAFEATRFELAGLDRAVTDRARAGWVQVLTVPERDRILGATIVGAHAGEMISTFVMAMTHRLGLNRILGTIHVYPTWMEADKAAAGAWKRAHAPARLLALAERFHAWRRG